MDDLILNKETLQNITPGQLQVTALSVRATVSTPNLQELRNAVMARHVKLLTRRRSYNKIGS